MNEPKVTTSDGETVSKWILGKQLGGLFGGKRKTMREFGKCYTFDSNKLLRMAWKYGLVPKQVTELTEATEFCVCLPNATVSTTVNDSKKKTKNNGDNEQHQSDTQSTQLHGKDGKLSYGDKPLDDVIIDTDAPDEVDESNEE